MACVLGLNWIKHIFCWALQLKSSHPGCDEFNFFVFAAFEKMLDHHPLNLWFSSITLHKCTQIPNLKQLPLQSFLHQLEKATKNRALGIDSFVSVEKSFLASFRKYQSLNYLNISPESQHFLRAWLRSEKIECLDPVFRKLLIIGQKQSVSWSCLRKLLIIENKNRECLDPV